MRTAELLHDFEPFFDHFRATWNACDADNMTALLSPDLAVRWAGPDSHVSDWGYNEAKKGWTQAYDHYQGRHPKWHFEHMHFTPADEQEVIATFWLRFELDGEFADVVKLFVQRFKKDEHYGWLLIREYCESLRPEYVVSKA